MQGHEILVRPSSQNQGETIHQSYHIMLGQARIKIQYKLRRSHLGAYTLRAMGSYIVYM